ncbi:hypothetical protein B0H21DRAFT_173355 [Amylocystis lapponica]|nr:hypothetical protein B0H21DRAFT_173355 [Amylocystis lapponica]
MSFDHPQLPYGFEWQYLQCTRLDWDPPPPPLDAVPPMAHGASYNVSLPESFGWDFCDADPTSALSRGDYGLVVDSTQFPAFNGVDPYSLPSSFCEPAFMQDAKMFKETISLPPYTLARESSLSNVNSLVSARPPEPTLELVSVANVPSPPRSHPRPKPASLRHTPYPEAAAIVTAGSSAPADVPPPPPADDGTRPGETIYSPTTGEPISVSERVVLPPHMPRPKRAFRRGTAVACLFCRKRKIACGGPPAGNPDKTCNQCARRNLQCEYAQTSYRGYRLKETQDADMGMIVFSPPSPEH